MPLGCVSTDSLRPFTKMLLTGQVANGASRAATSPATARLGSRPSSIRSPSACSRPAATRTSAAWAARSAPPSSSWPMRCKKGAESMLRLRELPGHILTKSICGDSTKTPTKTERLSEKLTRSDAACDEWLLLRCDARVTRVFLAETTPSWFQLLFAKRPLA